MPTTPTPTLEDLLAQKAALDKELATYELGPVTAIKSALGGAAFTNLLTTLEDRLAELPPESPSRVHVTQTLTVLRHTPDRIAEEHARLDGIVNPPEPIETPVAP